MLKKYMDPLTAYHLIVICLGSNGCTNNIHLQVGLLGGGIMSMIVILIYIYPNVKENKELSLHFSTFLGFNFLIDPIFNYGSHFLVSLESPYSFAPNIIFH